MKPVSNKHVNTSTCARPDIWSWEAIARNIKYLRVYVHIIIQLQLNSDVSQQKPQAQILTILFFGTAAKNIIGKNKVLLRHVTHTAFHNLLLPSRDFWRSYHILTIIQYITGLLRDAVLIPTHRNLSLTSMLPPGRLQPISAVPWIGANNTKWTPKFADKTRLSGRDKKRSEGNRHVP
jgi:hypothetical protein